jgi:hypothetical protein
MICMRVVRVQARVVRDEGAARGFGQPRLDHRVAPGFDLYAGLGRELRRAPIERERALGQRAQHVERSQRLREPRERAHMRLELLEQLLVQPFFARQRTLLRRQRLVLEGFELGRDEALGIFERLAAAIVRGHALQVAARDLDVKPVHLVELHAQVRDAGARFFAPFERKQKIVAPGLDRAQLVELGVEPRRDHAAVAHQRGRLGRDRAGKQIDASRGRLQRRNNLHQIRLLCRHINR